jgi:hypothetical protein
LRQGVVRSHEQLVDYLAQGSNAGLYINLLKTSIASGRVERTEMLFAPRTGLSFVPGYEAGQELSIQVLGPVPLDDSDPPRLKFLENEGVTKNGHSVILKMKYKQVSILLGGDLNSASETYLMDHYARQAFPSNQPLTSQQLVSGTRQFFEVDIAKACHHGSADFTNEFLQAINALCTVISSGDEESYSHPRPESLGAVGRFGRGIRPLIFSTELARSSPEKIKDPFELQEKLILAQSKERVSEFTEDLIEKLGRTVAVYGMITLRTDGNRVMLAQKLEQPRSKSQKWDMHYLSRDSQGKLIYQPDA